MTSDNDFPYLRAFNVFQGINASTYLGEARQLKAPQDAILPRYDHHGQVCGWLVFSDVTDVTTANGIRDKMTAMGVVVEAENTAATPDPYRPISQKAADSEKRRAEVRAKQDEAAMADMKAKQEAAAKAAEEPAPKPKPKPRPAPQPAPKPAAKPAAKPVPVAKRVSPVKKAPVKKAAAKKKS